jgi:hypothetical protein
VRIDVGPSGPWVVNEYGGIYAWNDATQAFVQKPGAAREIGVGKNGSVWVIGTNAVPGGYGIYRWKDAEQTFESIPGGAVAIDVDPDGNAWVINDVGAIYRYDGTTFVQAPGRGHQVSIAWDGAVYVIGHDPEEFGDGIYRWDGVTFHKVQGADGGATLVSALWAGFIVLNSHGMIYFC